MSLSVSLCVSLTVLWLSQIDGSPRARWEQSVRTLATRVDGVDTSQATLSAGFLIWRPQHEELRPDELLAGREAAGQAARESACEGGR